MTAEEKAKELWHKFLPHADNWDCYNDTPNTDNNPAKCAVILCDEMLVINMSPPFDDPIFMRQGVIDMNDSLKHK